MLLPLAGAVLGGRPLGSLFRFPPRENAAALRQTFSPLAAGAVAAALAVSAAWWWAGHARRRRPLMRGPSVRPARCFPVWGWLALAWLAAWWIVAWTRLPFFAAVQPYTFFPLWLGAIAGCNAVAWRRSGSCLLLREPRRLAALFAASAGFWWLFEWLNRFVRNWHYLGVAEFGPTAYAVHATLCFSTVLPAVASAAECLATFPAWLNAVRAGPSCPWLVRPGAGAVLIAAGAAGLVLTGLFPRSCYPAIWLAPLALLAGRVALRGGSDLLRALARGDWTTAGTWMAAALACGFCWELWNGHSQAKWVYTVPGVDRWHVFEMPLLGYSGYLPFGLECLFVAAELDIRPAQASPGR